MPEKNAEVLVVGAGLAGLAAALRLQAAGYRTVVLEANAQPGGKALSWERDGYRFDLGPSLLTLPDSLDELEKETDSRFGLEIQRFETTCHYFFPNQPPGSFYASSQDLASFQQELVQKFGEDETLTRQFFETARGFFESTETVFLKNRVPKWDIFLRPSHYRLFKKFLKHKPLRTYQKLIEQHFHTEAVRNIFKRYATYNGSDPARLLATYSLLAHVEHAKGTYWVKGGIDAIVRSIYNSCLEKGVEFCWETPVKRIRPGPGAHWEVESTHPETIRARQIVSATDFRMTQLFLEKKPTRYAQHQASMSGLVWLWGVQKDYPSLHAHNIIFSPEYDQEFRSIFNPFGYGKHPTIYINLSCRYEPHDAPAGGSNFFVMVNVGQGLQDDMPAKIAAIRAAVIRRLSSVLQDPQFEQRIAFERRLDPAYFCQQHLSFDGSIYGRNAHGLFGFLRPSMKVGRRFFQIGGTGHPGGGIPLALQSARILMKEFF